MCYFHQDFIVFGDILHKVCFNHSNKNLKRNFLPFKSALFICFSFKAASRECKQSCLKPREVLEWSSGLSPCEAIINIYIWEIVEALGKKWSHNDLLLRMESLMIHNSNHDDSNNDKSWSEDGLEIESNGLWMEKKKRWFIAYSEEHRCS